MPSDRSTVSSPRPAIAFNRRGVHRVSLFVGVGVAFALGTGPSISADATMDAAVAVAGQQDHHRGDGVGVGDDVAWGDDDTRQSSRAVKDGYWTASEDLGSLYSVTSRIGARAAWQRGITGSGVTVAVIDTGVTPVDGLDTRGKIVNGPDLSYESQRTGTRYLDGFGHGTHVAGIIAGEDQQLKPSAKHTDPRHFAGVAPDARILNMKVATGDGGADVTGVIAAIDWVVQHRDDQGMNVRVINLAYGTASTQGADVDPLAHATQNAWKHGIVVVAAAGNDGAASDSLLMPAADPYVIAVGAVDHQGTAALTDDTVADFSNDGNDTRRPDLLAPGKSVVSLRVPRSYVDDLYPEGRIAADKHERYLRGSGTSQATAVVSGTVALLLQQRPELSPDQVKALLTGTADPLASASPAQGSGVVDVVGLLDAPTPALSGVHQSWPASTGLGSLDASRGGEHVVDPATGDVLTGQVDGLGDPFDAASWAVQSAAGTAWVDGTWGIRPWTGSDWTTEGWAGTTWTGAAWSGLAWNEHSWSEAYWQARSWRDDSWLARSWRGGTWEARSWRETSWDARSWRDGAWSARSWRVDSWTARSWRLMP
jgi:serine protease AprX